MVIEDFIAKHELTLESTPIGEHVIDGKTPFKWSVTLRMKNNSYTTEYTMGPAYVVRKYSGRMMTCREIQYAVREAQYGNHREIAILAAQKPELARVLEGLQLDCLAVSDAGSFNDFCSNFGYNNDSIKAKACYDTLIQAYFGLKQFFGVAFLEFLNLEIE